MGDIDGLDQRQPTSGPKQITLFPEIIHMIIAYISDDKKSLQSASLLGKEWFYPSRCLLFRSISIKCDAQSSLPDKFLKRIGARTRLAALVHNLTLRPCDGGGKISLPSLFQVVRQLPSLDTLILLGPELVLSRRGKGIKTRIFANRHLTTRSVSKLILCNVKGPVDAFDLLFSSLPVRDSIDLEDVSVSCKPYGLEPPPSLTIPLHPDTCNAINLAIDTKGTYSPPAYRDYVGLQYYQPFFLSLHNLHSLSVGPLFWHPGYVLFHYSQKLLQERGSGIRHLRLDIRASRNRPSINWDLSECSPSLETLAVITCYQVIDDSDGNKNLYGVSDIVSLLSKSPHTLQKFTLELGNFRQAIDESVIDLTSVDKALSCLHHLEVVRIQGEMVNFGTRKPRVLPRGIPLFLSTRLPATESRGILQFGESED